MGHRLFADRFGTIQILKRELYSQKDFAVVDIDDYVNMTSGEYTIDPTVLRNRVIIQSNNGWQAFEDPFLRNYCNNEIISCGLEAPWAETEEQKWAVADRFFLDMRRKLRRISIAIKGNPSLDIGDLVRVKALISTANAKYMIIAIQTSFSSSGYIDILDLEFVIDSKGHICEKAEGSYEDVQGSTSDNASIPITGTKRDAIVQYALSFRGTPYQWGGDSAHNKNHFGMDCSHFTYAVFKKFGLMNGYGRAKDQYPWCNPISEGELQPGDLVFYASSSNPRSIYHVAIYIGNGQAVSASGGDSSTNSLARAKAQKAFVKTHNFAIKGNPSLDIGDLVRVKALISTANAKYMIIAIQTSFSSSGYIDILDLEFVIDSKGHICEKAEGSYEDVQGSTSDNASIPITGTKRDAIVQYALSFRGTPYQWGGDSAHNKNHFGMDCSHFTYAVFKKFGLMNGYGRAKDQYPWCNPISEGELQPGDLVFYASSSNPRSIYHVAIYIGNGQAVSASGGDSSTNSLARAKAQKAFVKTHNFKYMRATYFYGKIKGL